MIGKHQKTLRAIFADPVRSNINWAGIEAMLMALGAERDEREAARGSVLSSTASGPPSTGPTLERKPTGGL
jgi:hypothetical protein